VPPGDASGLAAALTRVLEEPALAASLVESGRHRATEFSMDRLAERYVEVYEMTTRAAAPVPLP
jgi:glycosyltransferase involved in cell wall biosynthesis